MDSAAGGSRSKRNQDICPLDDNESGRGTVATGRVEQGIIKVGDEVEVLGLMQGGPLKTTVTGVEMFKKILDQGQAGDNVGLLLCGLKRESSLMMLGSANLIYILYMLTC
ncbi:hypothetical protein RIF29_19190 [Crotalaria pallida]|uniref:Translation elongation factor EFTu-like domain-containing protein n=1 Tax=Crotalaria pallida TaxID=3830 RepID=A0AAN9I5A6_CROPI